MYNQNNLLNIQRKNYLVSSPLSKFCSNPLKLFWIKVFHQISVFFN
jgi:hypothetical protein